MMRTFILFLLTVSPFIIYAHPGIGMVKDSKGNIYYTDLQHVWKISNGEKKIVVRDVHTHELYMDKDDNLYGENEQYLGDALAKWTHYLWVLRKNGKLDTVVSLRQAYVNDDYSLARDKEGNEYYTKLSDSNRIYKRSNGVERIFAAGDFNKVNWLHPQDDGSILYTKNNNIYKINRDGSRELVYKQVGNKKPAFKFSNNNIQLFGLWKDNSNNIYAAVYSDQAIKKIDSSGKATEVYRSEQHWGPVHGLFDDHERLWVMEWSDKNEMRVLLSDRKISSSSNKVSPRIWFHLLLTAGFAGLVGWMFLRRRP